MKTLYSYWRSSCSYRVRIALNLKGIEYQIHPIHLLKEGGQQYSDEYKKLNPSCKVPTLEVFDENGNSVYISESTAICEYLEEVYSDVPLLPKQPIERAKVRAVYNAISSNIQPIQNLPVLNKISEIGGNKMEWGKYWIDRGLESVEQLVTQYRGKYCVGDQITLADAYLVPQLYNARRFNVDLTKFPNLIEIEERLLSEWAFDNAKPENQLDAEK